jgi:hypothetical protein
MHVLGTSERFIVRACGLIGIADASGHDARSFLWSAKDYGEDEDRDGYEETAIC